jgi:glucokinase
MAIGLDVGATKIAAALVAASGQVLASRQEKTRADQGVQTVLDRIVRLTNELAGLSMDDPDNKPIPLLGIGIGIPGQVNSRDGIVRDAVNLGWDEVNLVAEIQTRLARELPIWIETDTNASTLGEYYFGAARDCHDFVYISIGSGLGAGIMSNGMLVTGATWKAAELGHFSLDPNGTPCECGLRGCAETIVSGPGLLMLVTRSLAQGELSSRLGAVKELTTTSIVSAALEGDDLTLAALSEMGHHLGMVIALCASVLNPALIVIGGGLGIAAFDLIIPAARREIERRILPSLYSSLRISASQQVSSAIGAASLPLCHNPGVTFPNQNVYIENRS